MEPINVSDMYTSHDTALTWQPDFSAAEKRIEGLKDLAGEVDGRRINTPQARWAKAELAAETKRAQKHLAAITAAAKTVEPFREKMRAALTALKSAEQAINAAAEKGDTQALIFARADRDLKGDALMNARHEFGKAITAAATAHVSDAQLDFSPQWGDPGWGTKYLVANARTVPLYELGYHNACIDAARKQGKEADRSTMVKWITEETWHLDDVNANAAFAERWRVYCVKNGIALEAQAAE